MLKKKKKSKEDILTVSFVRRITKKPQPNNLLTVEKKRVLQNGLWMYCNHNIYSLISQFITYHFGVFFVWLVLISFIPVKNELKCFKAALYCLFWGNLRKTSYSRVFLLNFDLSILTQCNPANIFFSSFCLKSLSLLLINLIYLQQTFSTATHFQSFSLLSLTLWLVIAAHTP